jgi:hypothetical protein
MEDMGTLKAGDGLRRVLSRTRPGGGDSEGQRPSVQVLTFNWIIDDIVSYTGETHMCRPGGGGLQTAFGVRIAGGDCCISCRVGDDFPTEHEQYVSDMGAILHFVVVPGDHP